MIQKKKRNFGGLNKQYQSNVAKKDDYSSSAGANNHLFNKDVIKNAKFLALKDGESAIIKIIPYQVDETHPCVIDKSMNDGDMAYVLNYDQHCYGKDNTMVVCPHGTHGTACPICEKLQEMRDEDDGSEEMKKAIDNLRPRRRVMYNILLIKKDKDMNKDFSQVFLLAESHYLFEKAMMAELKKGDPDDEDSEYTVSQVCVGGVDDPKDARCLKVGCSGKGIAKEFSFSILREKAEWRAKYDEDELLDNAIPLHKAINDLTYSELEQLFNGASVSPSEEDDDEDDEEEKRAYEKPVKKAVKVEEDDVEDDEIPFDKGKSKADSEEDDVDEEEEEDASDDADDDPVDTGTSRHTCPYGHVFGTDAFTQVECRSCECMDACYAASNS